MSIVKLIEVDCNIAILEFATAALAQEEQEKYEQLVKNGTLRHARVDVLAYDDKLALVFGSTKERLAWQERFNKTKERYNESIRYESMVKMAEIIGKPLEYIAGNIENLAR